jgi:hypothetical protein
MTTLASRRNAQTLTALLVSQFFRRLSEECTAHIRGSFGGTEVLKKRRIIVPLTDLSPVTGSRNDARNGSVRNTPLAQGLGTLDGGGEPRPRDRLVELQDSSHAGADEGAYVRPTDTPAMGSRLSSGRYEAERRPHDALRHHQTSLDPQPSQCPTRQPTGAEDSAPKQTASRARPEARPQSLGDLLSHKPSKEVRRGASHALKAMAASIEEEAASSIESGYVAAHARKPPTPPTLPPRDKPSPPIPKPTPAHSPATSTLRRPEHAQLASEAAEQRTRMLQLPPPQSQAQRDAQRYGMFGARAPRNSSDTLFVRDDDDDDDDDEEEAVQVPAMQLVHEQEEGAEQRPVGLGKSMLGAPKKPPTATGTAPVAPMMHTSPVGKKGQ